MKEQSTSKGFAILSAAGMLVKVLSLLYIPFLIAIISDDGYGIYTAAYQVYAFVYVITNTGIPSAISKLISELTAVGNYRDAVRSFKIARVMLLSLGVIMTVLMAMLAQPLSRITTPKAYLAILALSPCVLFTSVASAYRGYFQGRKNMTPTAISQVMEQIMNTIFTLVFALVLVKYGVEAGCAGGTIGTTLGAFIAMMFLIFYYEKNKTFRVPRGYGSGEKVRRLSNKFIVKKILSYGIPITLAVGMTYAGNLVDTMNTMGRLAVAGMSEKNSTILFGYLVKYQQLMNVPIAIITSLCCALLPAISSANALKDRAQVKDKVNYAFRVSFLISVPSAVGLAVISEPIYQMLKFRGGSYLMTMGSVVLVLMSIVQIQTTILQSIGKLYTTTFYSFIGILFKIAANYALIAVPGINIKGAVIGSIIGYLIPIALNHRIINRTLKVRVNLARQISRPLAASAFMGVCVYIVQFDMSYLLGFLSHGYVTNAIATICSIVVGAMAYLFALAFTGGIRKRDLQSMPRKITRFIPAFILNRIK